MAIKKSGSKSLADQLADLEDPTPKDFDPEDSDRGNLDSENESGSGTDEDAGREHYESVGKSKLRKPEIINLGKAYAGSRVSREVLDDANDDRDPFDRSSDDDDDEKSDEEESGSEGEEEEEEEEEEEGISDGDREDESEDDASETGIADRNSAQDERAELRRLMATDQKSVAATISQAAKADANKGFAVKQQRLTFDALLNARIKLQKGFTSIINSSGLSWETESDNIDAIKNAETAALALWSTLEELRLTLADVQSQENTKKRKRPAPVSSETATETLWQRMQDLEVESAVRRRAILEKWNHKVRGTNSSLAQTRGKLLASSDNSISAVLEAHVATELDDHINKKKRTQDSVDPVYDDTAFYQSLLRDLVEQRMSSSDVVTNGLDLLQLQIPTHATSGMRKDKVRKDVDTKASKGRKMRYNVHEKLQNFMASEDRGTWSDRAREEFFASLLGKTAVGLLGEADEKEANGANGAGSDEEDLEESGLKLFRS